MVAASAISPSLVQMFEVAFSRRMAAIEGYTLPYSAPFFNEFVVRAPAAADELLRRLADEHNITGGLALSRYDASRPNDLLVCVTETNRRSEIDALVAGMKEVGGGQ